MPLAPGTRLGSYEILCALGAGGMGEVYRARDTKLGREVALKILPEAFASDPDRLMRFEREARTLAALNHPNIAQVYGVEESGQTRALVMELVAGEDLSARLARGPIPLDEALPLARQIAEALEAAHEAGIIHRDLKPANIKVRDDRTVKVLDFGLAKALDPSAPGATGTAAAGAPEGLADSPTITSPALTMHGVILGTAAYMAPEQARGRPVDKRADIWAFGCVLYEMLTGRRAFDGDDVADTLASVLRAEPAWHLLPADVPDAVRVLIRRCLEKDPHRRPSHLSVARFVLDAGAEMHRGAAALVDRSTSRRQRHRVAAGIFAALTVGAAVASALTWWVMRDGRAAIARSAPIRFLMTAETGAETWRISTDRPFALSPDGRAVAYRAHGNNRPQFFVRDLETIEPRLLIDGRLIRAPFFSPDGRWIAFFDGRELRKMRVTGGPAVTICQVSHEIVLGGSWGDDDSIVFAVSQPTSTTGYPGLLIVPASGGEPRMLTTVEPTSGEGAHVHPHVLPGSRGVLFTVRMRGQPPSEGRLMVLDRASGERREVAARGTAGQYIDGRVVHVDPQGLLQSLPFDLSKLAPSGPASPLAERVYVPPVGQPLFSVASSGALAFVPAIGGTTPETVRTVVWVDRHGRETPIPLPPRAYAVARLAPDGTRIALDIRDGDNDIWIWSIARGALTRMTREPALDFGPVWSPDSRRIIWSSTRSNPNPTLHRQAADGTGAPELLGIEGSPVYPGSVTPDGKHLIFFGATFAIQRLDLASADRLETVLAGSSLQATPEVSPDGRWLAYQSNESGAPEVYVRPYPNVEAGRWQISTQGGTRPAWRRDGRELFFLDGQERLSSASIAVKGDTLVPGAVQRILDTAYYPGFTTRGFNLRGYDVSPDGQRFLMIKRTEGGADSRSELTIVLNWSAAPR